MSESWTRSERLALLLACGSPGSAAAYHGLAPRFEVDLMQRNGRETRVSQRVSDHRQALPALRNWLARLSRPFRESIWQRELRDREAYLAGAQNLADVETRMRALERAAFSHQGVFG
ncbi:MAG: DUF3563 domain-containing protein [Burkholderiales bacterium]|nr:DUF3563 domain-containing protein [Burkholderiales bacterium]